MTTYLRRGAVGLAGAAAVVGLWAVVSTALLSTADGVPTPWAVGHQLVVDGWSFYQPHLHRTGSAALRGYLAGNGLAVGAAAVVMLVPGTERLFLQLALTSYCLPLVAVGPLLATVFGGDVPAMVLAGLAVFFTTLVGVLQGLRSVSPAAVDLVWACGGSRWQTLRRVRLMAALPSTFAALKIAAPAALLGAIIGEYLGRVDTGLGVALTISEQQLEVARTWAVALVCSALAGAGYGAVTLLQWVALPWARGTVDGGRR